MDPREATDHAVQDLLAADTVLPEQFWADDTIRPSGERALMWAVFADGIECYRRNLRSTSVQQRVAFEEAERWAFCTDWDWPFSFVNLCEAFGFDPAGVRHALLRCKRQQATRAVRRQRFRPVALRAA